MLFTNLRSISDKTGERYKKAGKRYKEKEESKNLESTPSFLAYMDFHKDVLISRMSTETCEALQVGT